MEKIEFKHKVLKISMNKKRVKIIMLGYFINPDCKKIEDARIYIDQEIYKTYEIKQYKKKLTFSQMLKNKLIKTYTFKMEEIINSNSEINGIVRVSVKIDGNIEEYRLRLKTFKKKNPRMYYVPIKSMYINEYAILIRRTMAGSLVFVKRLKEDVEKTLKFKLLENKLFSKVIYKIGKIYSKIRRKKVNLFYEKFSEKAEEGVFDLCKKCEQSKNSKNYYIIDENSLDYSKIKDNKNVVKKYSLKYYWLIYSANNFIGSEAPAHLNIVRSNNKYFRKALIEKNFIFLQHGIIYMKNLGVNTYYNKGRESECKYMVISSEKEATVVSNMLGYERKQLLKTGLRNL